MGCMNKSSVLPSCTSTRGGQKVQKYTMFDNFFCIHGKKKHKNTQNTKNTLGHILPYNEPHMPEGQRGLFKRNRGDEENKGDEGDERGRREQRKQRG